MINKDNQESLGGKVKAILKGDSTHSNKNVQKWIIIKNYLAINMAFVLLFSSKNSVNGLQPLIHQDKNLGNIGQLVSFCVNLVTSLVIPQVVIDLIGYKFTLMLGIFLTTTFVIVQLFLNMTSLMIASVLNAFGSSFCWTILGIYLTVLSRNYSHIMCIDFRKIQTFLFGLNASLFALAYAIGYGISGAVLDTKTKHFFSANDSSSYDYADQCGISNCPSTRLPDSKSKPTDDSFYILYAIYITFCSLSLLITFIFMDNIKDLSIQIETEQNNKITILQRFSNEITNLFKLFIETDLWLLFPLTFYSGFELTFVWFEYSRAFSTCLLGVNYVGWTNILFGVLSSGISLIMTYFLKLVGVQIGIVFMLMMSLMQCVFILSWTPNADSGKVLVFIMAIGFALSMSVHFGQTRGLYGVYFPKNMQSAMSAANLSQTTGFFMGSLFSTYICTGVKIWVHFAICILALLSYCTLIVKHSPKEIKDSNTFKNQTDFNLVAKSQLTVISDDIRI